jgi:hypothetical protein
MRAVVIPGRLVWGVSGLATVLALGAFTAHLISGPWTSGQGQQIQSTVTRTVTIPQPVTSVNVQSYGASVQVTGSRVNRVEVTETIGVPGPGNGTPSVAAAVHDGRLSVGGPACNSWENCVRFMVTVPRDVAVTVASQGAPVTVSDVATVNLDSDNGSMNVSGIDGPVAVTTGGGPLNLTDVTGPVQADTDGGSLTASGVTATTAILTSGGGPAQVTGSIGTLGVYTDGGSADVRLTTAPATVTVDTGGGPGTLAVPNAASTPTPKATVSTDGGSARVTGSILTLGVYTDGGPADVGLATAPDTVTIDTDGGSGTLAVPGGPYALTTDGDGGSQSVTIATSPTATRSITLTTGGGPLQIEP